MLSILFLNHNVKNICNRCHYFKRLQYGIIFFLPQTLLQNLKKIDKSGDLQGPVKLEINALIRKAHVKSHPALIDTFNRLQSL